MLESLTISSFAGLVGPGFLIGSDAEGAGLPLEAELVEVTQAGEPGPDGGRVPFSLVFRARSDPFLPQRIYRVEHAEIGVVEIFLVPIGPDATGMRYQAVFS